MILNKKNTDPVLYQVKFSLFVVQNPNQAFCLLRLVLDK